MRARMTNAAHVLATALKGVGTLLQGIGEGGVPGEPAEIVGLRAGQNNGCSVCVHAHTVNLRKAGASEERIAAVGAWREAPFFSDVERAALRPAGRMTRLADRSELPVPDALWDEVAGHFDETRLSALILTISLTTMFNRFSTTIRDSAGTTWGRGVHKSGNTRVSRGGALSVFSDHGRTPRICTDRHRPGRDTAAR
ncbi:AhpD family alkylhydroperoxidase [Streptomyces griseochromogenes]|uniref:Alkylhydroperoxidase n=1 Tax=Streptomyces griseochromogenes TaxID=68214 RepID=A0A1B1AQF6_9ACTN|nr:carboxymuconolactone decarboxylase family protein [Streptomyces griseochromogenes]ANP48811.1 alkylhydroperoxidase [Streptomyces griseochromogenes]MBP2054020.1 AhpD family alkylhydroperoxidase [Streptomyces griseochromogenes]